MFDFTKNNSSDTWHKNEIFQFNKNFFFGNVNHFSKHYRMFDFMKKITFQVEQKWFSGNKKFYFSYRLKNSQILYNLYSLMNHFLKKLLVTKRLKLMWKIILPILKKKWNFSIQRTFFFSGNGNYHFLLHYGMLDFTWNEIIISHSVTKKKPNNN